MNKVRMNLTQGDEGPGAVLVDSSQLPQKFLPILLDCGASILLGESQIQRPPAVNCGESAWPRAEAVNEPGNGFKRVGLQDLALNSPGNLEGHPIILAMSLPSGTFGIHSEGVLSPLRALRSKALNRQGRKGR